MSVMRAYPTELRSRVVAAVAQDELTIAEIARVFSVGLTFVKKMLRLHRAGEALTPRHGGGPIPLLQEAERELLRAAVAQQADVTLAELQALLEAQGTQARVPTLCQEMESVSAAYKEVLAGVVKDTAPASAAAANAAPVPACNAAATID